MAHMRVSFKPGRHVLRSDFVHLDDLADLQPAEEGMYVWRALGVVQMPRLPCCLPEPSEKQEQVANAYLLILKVPLRGSDLSKRRPPAGQATKRLAIQVRVQVDRLPVTQSTASQIVENLAEGLAEGGYTTRQDSLWQWDRQ